MGGGASIAFCATSEDFPPARKTCSGRDHATDFTPKSSGDPQLPWPRDSLASSLREAVLLMLRTNGGGAERAFGERAALVVSACSSAKLCTPSSSRTVEERPQNAHDE
jgi:hypothetical protein